jgi:dethiobiotin synthetase
VTASDARASLRGLFVTGTDTAVGKTTVACALLRAACRLGQRPIPFKPAETGCAPTPADAHRLWEAARAPIALDDVCLYALSMPAAPAQAAAAAGVVVQFDDIVAHAVRLGAEGDLLIVEGAGGLLVPYTGALTAADLAARLAIPILVVARTVLGTVNHTALTVRELDRRGLPLAGVVLVQTTPVRAPHEAGNADLIEAVSGIRPLGTLPYLHSRDPDSMADAISGALGEATVKALLGVR